MSRMLWWRARCALGMHPLEWRSVLRPIGDGSRSTYSAEHRCRRDGCVESERWMVADVEIVPTPPHVRKADVLML